MAEQDWLPTPWVFGVSLVIDRIDMVDDCFVEVPRGPDNCAEEAWAAPAAAGRGPGSSSDPPPSTTPPSVVAAGAAAGSSDDGYSVGAFAPGSGGHGEAAAAADAGATEAGRHIGHDFKRALGKLLSRMGLPHQGPPLGQHPPPAQWWAAAPWEEAAEGPRRRPLVEEEEWAAAPPWARPSRGGAWRGQGWPSRTLPPPPPPLPFPSAGGGNKQALSASSTGAVLRQTTVTLQGLALSYSRSTVVQLLEKQGFRGHFDFLYVPCNFSSGAPFGYAFVNFRSEAKAAECWQRLDGFAQWGVESDRVCEVCWADIQGLGANIDRYRNSPVMHPSVHDRLKPILLDHHGGRCPFPPATRPLKAPRAVRRDDPDSWRGG